MPTPIMTSSAGVTCRLSLSADLEAVRDNVHLARRFLAEQNLAGYELIACELALVEACNNAIASSQAGIEIELCCGSNLVEMHVIDHGPGFDWPDEVQLPDASEEHGRGLFIIKSLVQEVFYLRGRGQNRLIMRMPRTMESNGMRTSSSAATSCDIKSPENSRAQTRAKPVTAEDGLRSDPSGNNTAQNASHPERLAQVEQKLALSEHVIGTMAKEICFRAEELAAIFRSTSELGRANDIEAFSERLLNDLLHLTGADWFVLRLLPKDGQKLILANASTPGLALPPIDLNVEVARASAEAKAALSKADVFFDQSQPLSPDDSLARAHPSAAGLVKPISMGETLLGTLAIGRNGNHPRFSADQTGVIHTFSEFLAIQIINIRLQQQHLDHRLTTRELEIARNIQQSLLPKRFPTLAGYGLSGFCLSARQVGGDFFDVLPLTEDKVLLVVADVMGKGVPAALFAATLHTLIRTMAEWTHRPVELLERVNRLIYDELSGVDMFITAQIALADTRKRRLVVANAGHCPLLVTRRDNTVQSISPEGMPLGILPDVAFEHVVVPLAECASAVLYTDGLTEARNTHGEFFGQERLFEWLKQNQSPKQTAAGLSEAFLAELKSFQGPVSLSDDQTFLILAEQSQVPSETEALADEESVFVQIPACATASAQS